MYTGAKGNTELVDAPAPSRSTGALPQKRARSSVLDRMGRAMVAVAHVVPVHAARGQGLELAREGAGGRDVPPDEVSEQLGRVHRQANGLSPVDLAAGARSREDHERRDVLREQDLLRFDDGAVALADDHTNQMMAAGAEAHGDREILRRRVDEVVQCENGNDHVDTFQSVRTGTYAREHTLRPARSLIPERDTELIKLSIPIMNNVIVEK